MGKINFAPKEERVDEVNADEILDKAADLFADVFVIAIDELVERRFFKGRKGSKKDYDRDRI